MSSHDCDDQSPESHDLVNDRHNTVGVAGDHERRIDIAFSTTPPWTSPRSTDLDIA